MSLPAVNLCFAPERNIGTGYCAAEQVRDRTRQISQSRNVVIIRGAISPDRIYFAVHQRAVVANAVDEATIKACIGNQKWNGDEQRFKVISLTIISGCPETSRGRSSGICVQNAKDPDCCAVRWPRESEGSSPPDLRLLHRPRFSAPSVEPAEVPVSLSAQLDLPQVHGNFRRYSRHSAPTTRSFNEAPADLPGNLYDWLGEDSGFKASMRPRQICRGIPVFGRAILQHIMLQ